MSLELEIKTLEETLLHTNINTEREKVLSLLSNELVEIGVNGHLTSKAQIIAWLEQKDPNARWVIENFTLNLSSENACQCHYIAKRKGSTSNGSIRSSLWKNTGNGWQLTFAQGTLISK